MDGVCQLAGLTPSYEPNGGRERIYLTYRKEYAYVVDKVLIFCLDKPIIG
jgi:hypothetical protein